MGSRLAKGFIANVVGNYLEYSHEYITYIELPLIL